MLDQLTLSSQSLPLGGAARERDAAMGRVLSSYLSLSIYSIVNRGFHQFAEGLGQALRSVFVAGL